MHAGQGGRRTGCQLLRFPLDSQ